MDFVGINIRNKIKELGRLWKESSENQLKISMDVLNSWNNLIAEWTKDESMPLIIRKGNYRGQEFSHPSGRKVIISDNTFALWVYHNVLNEKIFDLFKLKSMLNSNKIPMVYVLTNLVLKKFVLPLYPIRELLEKQFMAKRTNGMVAKSLPQKWVIPQSPLTFQNYLNFLYDG